MKEWYAGWEFNGRNKRNAWMSTWFHSKCSRDNKIQTANCNIVSFVPGASTSHLEHTAELLLHSECAKVRRRTWVQLCDISVWRKHQHLMRWTFERQGKCHHGMHMQKSMEQLSHGNFPPKRTSIIKVSACCSLVGAYRIQMEHFIHLYEQNKGTVCVEMCCGMLKP